MLFVDVVVMHRSGRVDVPGGSSGREWRRDLTLRVTDQVTQESTGLIPLSVSADRIGHTAMRCAGLLAELTRPGRLVDRSGEGVVVEVYPAASLKRWGLPHRGYRRAANLGELGRLADALKMSAPWLGLDSHQQTCRISDDAFDAVVAALTARAASLCQTTGVPPQHLRTARTEGWIALPGAPLSALRT
jgi:predicted nuclease with RNAse H fold